MDDSEQPYKILSPTKVWMSAATREWARQQYGWTDRETAKYFLQQEKLRAAESERDVMGPELPPQSVSVEEGSMPKREPR
jgi:hypothetical protein